jgi:fumarate hydratase, class II
VKYRIEHDSLGDVEVPFDALFGPQTQRSRQNFNIGGQMPVAVITELIQIKKAAAIVNANHGTLKRDKADAIIDAADHLLTENYHEAFPLHIYQTGSGTQTNMNINEVIANLAHHLHADMHIHPNDDVNQSQSSNDTFPTAMMMAAYQAVTEVLTTTQHLIETLAQKQNEFSNVVKIGRTHLQDATPLTVGQEISGWQSAIEHDRTALKTLQPQLLELPIGGTAVGTGLNTFSGFDQAMVEQLSHQTGIQYQVASNKFQGLANHSQITAVHGIFKALATDLIKVGNDIRFLASGPRAGYNELNIPANEPGSSIMPGKVNPTQVEALTMVGARVMGNDTTIGFANSQGNFEMNVYKPIIIASFLESAHLLTQTIRSFTDRLVSGLTINQNRITELLDNSLMLVTALSPHIGYEKSAHIAQWAQQNQTTLKVAAQHFDVSATDFEKWVVPAKMTHPNK